MPATAVIPAPVVYGSVAETITFVVGTNGRRPSRSNFRERGASATAGAVRLGVPLGPRP